jgi:hypothetical protein
MKNASSGMLRRVALLRQGKDDKNLRARNKDCSN